MAVGAALQGVESIPENPSDNIRFALWVSCGCGAECLDGSIMMVVAVISQVEVSFYLSISRFFSRALKTENPKAPPPERTTQLHKIKIFLSEKKAPFQ